MRYSGNITQPAARHTATEAKSTPAALLTSLVGQTPNDSRLCHTWLHHSAGSTHVRVRFQSVPETEDGGGGGGLAGGVGGGRMAIVQWRMLLF